MRLIKKRVAEIAPQIDKAKQEKQENLLVILNMDDYSIKLVPNTISVKDYMGNVIIGYIGALDFNSVDELYGKLNETYESRFLNEPFMRSLNSKETILKIFQLTKKTQSLAEQKAEEMKFSKKDLDDFSPFHSNLRFEDGYVTMGFGYHSITADVRNIKYILDNRNIEKAEKIKQTNEAMNNIKVTTGYIPDSKKLRAYRDYSEELLTKTAKQLGSIIKQGLR